MDSTHPNPQPLLPPSLSCRLPSPPSSRRRRRPHPSQPLARRPLLGWAVARGLRLEVSPSPIVQWIGGRDSGSAFLRWRGGPTSRQRFWSSLNRWRPGPVPDATVTGAHPRGDGDQGPSSRRWRPARARPSARQPPLPWLGSGYGARR